jgi:hypothetical protein
MEKPTNIWKEFSQSKEGEKAFTLIENERATEGAKIILEEGRLSAFKEMRDWAKKEITDARKRGVEYYSDSSIYKVLEFAEAKLKEK